MEPLLLSPREQRLYRLFTELAAANTLARARTERMLPDGMSLAQFALLAHLARKPAPDTPAKLAAAFAVTKQTMTSTLRRSEAIGLIAVTADPQDGRRKRVTLTDAGRAAHRRCLRELGPALAGAVDAVPDTLVEILIPQIERLRAALEKAPG